MRKVARDSSLGGFFYFKEIAMNNGFDQTPLTYTVKEAAKLLGLSSNTAYALARNGELPGIRRLGRRFVVSRSELGEYLNIKNKN